MNQNYSLFKLFFSGREKVRVIGEYLRVPMRITEEVIDVEKHKEGDLLVGYQKLYWSKTKTTC